MLVWTWEILGGINLWLVWCSLSKPQLVIRRLLVLLPDSLRGLCGKSIPIVTGDFDCSGRKQQAILRVNKTEIAVLVFVHGIGNRPEILRYLATVRNPNSAELTVESLDYDPKAEIGADLPGFQRSMTCQGLNLSDGEVDSAHIYWNHNSNHFEDWSR
jgi:hypothetical protein